MRRAILAVLAVLAFTGAAAAENYPSHPITVIVAVLGRWSVRCHDADPG